MPEKPIMHGRDHRPGGTDPIPGLGAGITHAVLRKTSTQTIAHGATAGIAWDEFETTDSSNFSYSSFFNHVSLATPGLYQWWLTLAPDLGNDWPASGTGNINFGVTFTVTGTISLASRQLFAQYPYVTEETGQTTNDGTQVSAMGIRNCENNSTASGFITNNTSSSWILGIGAVLFIIRLADNVTF